MLPALASATLICTSPLVTDGDTIRCAGERVRIWAIDTPERGEPGYDAATRHLERITAGKRVVCVLPPSGQDRDRYGRAVRLCAADGLDVGRAQIEAGHAVEMHTYSKGYYGR